MPASIERRTWASMAGCRSSCRVAFRGVACEGCFARRIGSSAEKALADRWRRFRWRVGSTCGCFKVAGKLFAWMSPHEPGALAVRVDADDQALIAAARP